MPLEPAQRIILERLDFAAIAEDEDTFAGHREDLIALLVKGYVRRTNYDDDELQPDDDDGGRVILWEITEAGTEALV